jgi:hypothetical protein
MFRASCNWEGWEGEYGLITDNSETLGLDNLESEVAGGTCGTADRSGVS